MSEHKWLDQHPIAHPDHRVGLEADAARYEFKHGFPKEEAEKAAHRDYVRENAFDSAAHHLVGARAARAAGQEGAAAKHGEAYAEALKIAGEEPIGPTPGPVLERIKANPPELYRFKAHPVDQFLDGLDSDGIQKAESESIQTKLDRLRAIVNC